ncbi:MAG: 30S ribosome-binding factor RbfA [Elusimicrobia bacterium]|nr:30S ribosome-binding factor RbfA [Elusimicrobiota bacterium]
MYRYKRAERVKELLREEISQYVQQIQDPGLGFVTITEVKLTDDLRHARMYYSVLGEEEQKQQTHAILQEHLGPMRKTLGKRLTLKRIPEIKLVRDDTSEKASHIFSLLDQIHAEKKDSE